MNKIDFGKYEIFTKRDGTKVTYDELLRDIYENSSDSKESIKTLMTQLMSMMNNPNEAVLLMEHVTNLLDARVKNDDLLVKVASIVSRIIQKKESANDSDEGSGWFTDEELKQLREEINDEVELKDSEYMELEPPKEENIVEDE